MQVRPTLALALCLVLVLQIFTYTQFNITHTHSSIIPEAYADLVSHNQVSAVEQNMTSLGFKASEMSSMVCDVPDIGGKNLACVALSNFIGTTASGGQDAIVQIKFWKNSTLASADLKANYDNYNNYKKIGEGNGMGIHLEQFNSSSGAPSFIYYIEHSTGGGGGYIQTSDQVEALFEDGSGEFQCGTITGTVDAESRASKGDMDAINNMKGDTSGAINALSDKLSAQAGPAGKDWINKVTQTLASANLCGTPHLPIIFLPGVAGTYLDEVTSDPNFAASVNLWPFSYGSSQGMLLKPDGITPAYTSQAGYHVVTNGIFANHGMTSGANPFNFYGGFEDYLVNNEGYTLGKDLVEFPYDWRLDNQVHLAELDQLVNQVRSSTGQSKVILIAHSMGGVIAKAYVDSIGSSKVDTLITIGTPFFGAVKPYYALVNGYTFGNPFINPLVVKALAQNSAAVYELCPWVPFVYDAKNNQYLTLDQSFQMKYKDVNMGTLVFYSGTDNVWSPNNDLIQSAKTFHNLIGTKDSPYPLPSGVKHYAIIGTGVTTLDGFIMADQPDSETSYIEVMDRHVKLIPQYGDGDGTVPMFSSQISGVTGTYYVSYQIGASSEHGALTDNSNVQKIVKSILDGKPSNYYTSYNEGATIDKDSTDFAVHSNVHTTIIDETTGNKLGYNSNGGIDEGIDGGTFLSMDGGTYAHISGASDTYKVILNGTNNGQFTLITNVTKSGQSTVFSYPSVPVQQGTIAQVEIAPNQVSSSNIPTLQVNTAGQTSSVSAMSGLISPSTSSQTQTTSSTTSLQIPSWIKHNADWWSQGQIGDDDFVKGIQYLINHGIMVIPQSQAASQQSQQIPSWVKHNAGWWAQGQIGDDDFVKGIQFMISNGIMTVGPASSSTQTPSSVQSPTTTNQNPIQQQVNSLPSQSSNSYFKMDKSSYMAMANPNEMATISGKINANGGVVVLIIEKPDGTSEHITADVTNVGDFRTLIIIDSSFPRGTYTINGSYQGSDLGSVTFTVD